MKIVYRLRHCRRPNEILLKHASALVESLGALGGVWEESGRARFRETNVAGGSPREGPHARLGGVWEALGGVWEESGRLWEDSGRILGAWEEHAGAWGLDLS